MSTKSSLEDGWTSLPADMAPIAGLPIERLRELEGPGGDGFSNIAADLLRFGKIVRKPPGWVAGGRTADWWLVDPDDDSICCPLAWNGQELVATIVLWRESEQNPRTAKQRHKLENEANQRRIQRDAAARRHERWLKRQEAGCAS